MKKTYINPTLMVVKIKTTGMLATSLEITGNDATQDGSDDYNDARGGFSFDEEDEW